MVKIGMTKQKVNRLTRYEKVSVLTDSFCLLMLLKLPLLFLLCFTKQIKIIVFLLQYIKDISSNNEQYP